MHSGVGETIAPDLTGMFVHPKKDILGNIIDPSRDVESNFRSYSVISNGKAYVGMFAGESRTTVTHHRLHRQTHCHPARRNRRDLLVEQVADARRL